MNYKDLDDRACEVLCAKVAAQAVKDYRDEYRRHKITWAKYVRLKNMPRNPKVNHELKLVKNALKIEEAAMKDIEKFFRSDWFTALTNVDGEVILRKLQEE